MDAIWEWEMPRFPALQGDLQTDVLIVGSGLAAAEAIPCAFGLMVAAKGDALETIYGGVNVGNDTDTVATIAGSMVGTLKGYKAYPAEWLELINKVNGYDLEKIAREFDSLS